jgi:hypothetical protein
LPDFVGTTYQNGKNIPNKYKTYQMTILYTKWPLNSANGRQQFTFQDPSKFTQIKVLV